MLEKTGHISVREGRRKQRRGRVAGVRMSKEQFEELWKLARRGFTDPATTITYDDGDENFTAFSPANLWEQVGDVDELDNVVCKVWQDNPYRSVEIEIGPDRWTTYTVQADDSTWALGRYEELTEKLVAYQHFLVAVATKKPEISSGAAWIPRDVWSKNSVRKWELATAIAISMAAVGAATATAFYVMLTVAKLTGIMWLEDGKTRPVTPEDLAYRGMAFWGAVGLWCLWATAKRLTAINMRSRIRTKPPRREYDSVAVLSLVFTILSVLVAVAQLVSAK